MSTYQILLKFNSKTYTHDVSDSTKITDLKTEICQKFNLPYSTRDDGVKTGFPFYLSVGTKHLYSDYNTIREFNRINSSCLITKEVVIHIRVRSFSPILCGA